MPAAAAADPDPEPSARRDRTSKATLVAPSIIQMHLSDWPVDARSAFDSRHRVVLACGTVVSTIFGVSIDDVPPIATTSGVAASCRLGQPPKPVHAASAASSASSSSSSSGGSATAKKASARAPSVAARGKLKDQAVAGPRHVSDNTKSESSDESDSDSEPESQPVASAAAAAAPVASGARAPVQWAPAPSAMPMPGQMQMHAQAAHHQPTAAGPEHGHGDMPHASAAAEAPDQVMASSLSWGSPHVGYGLQWRSGGRYLA